MTYLRRPHKQNTSHAILWWTVLVLAMIIVTLNFSSWTIPIGQRFAQVAWKLARPIRTATAAVTLPFTSKNALLSENAKLKRSIQLFTNEKNRIAVIEEENKVLRDVFSRSIDRSFVASYMLRNGGSAPYDVIVLDAGAREGIQTGDRVFSDSVTAIGVITRVFDTTSFVSLFSSPTVTTTCILGAEGVVLECVGQGSGNYEIKVPRDIDVAIGDAVFLPGIRHDILGMIDEIIDGGLAQSVKTLLFRAPVQVEKESILLIEAEHSQ
ncbi:MAG: hypothetical protein A2928_04280 [Candidatus Taylorbacteria bacterium RIFCSPLOWO2_01_FULL_45_15b]|uniref:Rod shape-determining protein MreC beta-barrel core domain-containing protein n=1 Tax=Candidatus Taylorbacteria bacterium RIFCSPLOWO2_01_FULL_45_15b TaxID=1802319 RepID=A0A1G2NEJ8_9BACT|nr:MAG: hypothetical protein A2928_04280 [Candidatus Taylorbacteria bacterium RIFCSPLOWO2_01_FULL_45_15b]